MRPKRNAAVAARIAMAPDTPPPQRTPQKASQPAVQLSGVPARALSVTATASPAGTPVRPRRKASKRAAASPVQPVVRQPDPRSGELRLRPREDEKDAVGEREVAASPPAVRGQGNLHDA